MPVGIQAGPNRADLEEEAQVFGEKQLVAAVDREEACKYGSMCIRCVSPR
jgi:hypothetical protein